MTYKSAPMALAGTVCALAILACCCANPPQQSTSAGSTQPAAPAKRTAPAPKPAEQVVSVSAKDLMAAYKANEVAADQKYKGRRCRVAGVVDSINKDFTGSAYVVLGTGASYEFNGVHVEFSSGNDAVLARLQKGQSLTIVGDCDGMVLTSPIVRDASL